MRNFDAALASVLPSIKPCSGRSRVPYSWCSTTATAAKAPTQRHPLLSALNLMSWSSYTLILFLLMEPVASAVLRRPQSDLRTAPGFLSFSQVVEHMGHDGVQKMSARNFYRLLCKEKREKAIQGLALNLLPCRRNVKA